MLVLVDADKDLKNFTQWRGLVIVCLRSFLDCSTKCSMFWKERGN